MQNEHAVSVLNGLIETCKDGEHGFKTAAEGLSSQQLKSRFFEYAREREQMAHELQDEVKRLGGDPEQRGSVAASVHRGWINIKAVVSGKDDHAIVAEAERGEDLARDAFEEALKGKLPASAQTIVQQDATRIREAHDAVKAMRDQQTATK